MKRVRAIIVASAILPFQVLVSEEAPKANIHEFRNEIEPLLKTVCVGCHGPEKQKAK